MKGIFFKTFLLFTGLALISCEAEDLYDQKAEEYNSRMLSVFIYDSDLVGEWDLNAMVAENPVDLNNDGETNNNLLLETDCFDPVSIIFNGDKTFSSVNYSMEIKNGEEGDEYLCLGRTTETGDWSLRNNTLTFYIRKNGSVQKYERDIILNEGSFVFEVDANESNNYVKQEVTSSSGISIVALEYSRSEK